MSTIKQAPKAAPKATETKAVEAVDLDNVSMMPIEELEKVIAEQSGSTVEDPKVKAFAAKLHESASAATNVADALDALRKEGIKVEVSVSPESLAAAGIKVVTKKTDWWMIAKWVGGGLTTALIVYGTYKLYVSYKAGKAAKAAVANNGTIQL